MAVRFAVVLPIALGLALPPAPQAAALGRDEFVERAEKICRAETEAHGEVLKGVEGMVRHGRLKQAASHLADGARFLRAAVARLEQLPRPDRDRGRLARWFGYSETGVSLLREMADDLRAGRRRPLQRLTHELLREARRANAVVVGFPFDYCRVSPARFA